MKALVSRHNNQKILACVNAFDRHMNMILEQIKEVWTEVDYVNLSFKRKTTRRTCTYV